METAPSNLKPEWLRPKDAARVFGISLTTLYRLQVSGAVKTSLLKARNRQKGIRLFNFDSLAAHIAKHSTGGE